MNINNDKMSNRLTWWRGFLTSLLGTSIGVGLTFGVNRWLDNYKQKKAQRTTAMMVINDMDESIQKLQSIMDNEEKCFNATKYLMESINAPHETLPADTVNWCLSYILQGYSFSTEFEFDESIQKIFESNMESWRSLNDINFAHNAEEFYKERTLLRNLESMYFVFRKPISYEESMDDLQTDFLYDKAAMDRYFKAKLADKRILGYLSNYYHRRNVYRGLIQNWRYFCETNKFLMNITDEEMLAFENSTTRQVNPADDKSILGRWKDKANEELSSEYEFRSDHTMSIRQIALWEDKFYTGKLKYIAIVEGTWRIEGDTINVIYQPSSCKCELDETGISYSEEMRDSVRRQLTQIKELYLQDFRGAVSTNGGSHKRATNIDMAGKRLELTSPEGQSIYFRRIE